MGSRLRKRVVHLANLPIKLLMPTNLDNIREIAIKTIPSASKIEIKRILESLYGFEVDNVRTLNMEGKKLKRGGILYAKPDYKKAYITLKKPLSLPSNIFPVTLLEDAMKKSNKQSTSSISNEQEAKKHWLSTKDEDKFNGEQRPSRPPMTDVKKFPWSYMKSWK